MSTVSSSSVEYHLADETRLTKTASGGREGAREKESVELSSCQIFLSIVNSFLIYCDFIGGAFCRRRRDINKTSDRFFHEGDKTEG